MNELINAAKQKKLFSIWQITVACLLSSVASSALLIALNYREHGDEKNFKKSILIGSLLTFCLLVIVNHLNYSTTGLTIGINVAVYYFYKRHYLSTYNKLIAEGASKQSWWTAIGISLLCVAIVYLLAVAFTFLFTFIVNSLQH